MMITNVKIENFRCFKSIELEFEKLQALVGENGSGKTAILEAINYVTSQGYAGFKIEEQDFNAFEAGNIIKIEVTFDSCFINQVPDGYVTQNIPCRKVVLQVHRREQSAGKALSDEFVIEHFTIPETYDKNNPLTAKIAVQGFDVSKLPIEIRKTGDPTNYQLIRRSTGKAMELGPRLLSINNDKGGFPDVFYFDRDREKEAKRGFNTLLQRVNRDLNWRYKKVANHDEITTKWEEYYNSVIGLVESRKSSQIIEPIRYSLKEVLGKEFNNLELSLLNIKQPFNYAFFTLREQGKADQIEVTNIGSGISVLLAYFLLKTISEMSKEEIILLIDEPELHLHPQVQIKLFDEFKKSKYQILFATQSDLFVDISEWRMIKRLSEEFDYFPKTQDLNTRLENRTIASHLDEIKRFHQHETIYSKEDNALFFARKCLLVEGPVEKYGIPRIAAILDKSLNELTIIACIGKNNIPYYQQLCKAYDIPFFTLFDLDGGTVSSSENSRPYNWASQNAVAVFSTSFEELLGVTTGRGTDVLLHIDGISSSNQINDEIKEAIDKISGWSKNN